MEKKLDYKKIELKVSINCCEGCKRKVKKAIRNLEGVLNIDIDPLQPKITVSGNVNPQILIKRLQKVGKHAEVCSYEEEVEAEEKEKIMSKENEKQDTMWEQEKQPHPSAFKIEKIKNATSKKKVSKDYKKMTYNACSHQEVKKEGQYLPNQELNTFMVHPSIINPCGSNIKTQSQYFYIAQPCAVAIPYYAIASYSAPSLPQACVEEHHYDMPRFQPPFLRPITQVGDYFSDENTMGCSVM